LTSLLELLPEVHETSGNVAVKTVPALRREYIDCAFLDPTALALDVAAIRQGYIHGLKLKGGEVVYRAPAQRFDCRVSKWHVATSASEFAAPVVIIATGAWSDIVADRIGAKSIGL
jgi:D-arginine dehydrogenase